MKKILKKISWVSFLLILVAVLTGCSGNSEKAVEKTSTAKETDSQEEYETLTLRYQGWGSRVLFAELAEELGYLAPLKLEWVGDTVSGPQDIQSVATGEIDFGQSFNGAIIQLKNRGADLKAVIGVNGTDRESYGGVFSLEGSGIKDAKDLVGKKIAVNTLGGLADFVVREYLLQSGLTAEEIDTVELVAIPTVEQSLRSGQVDAAYFGFTNLQAALQTGGLQEVFLDYDIIGETSYTSVVFRESFIKENPKTVAKFVDATAKAIEWAREQPVEEVVKVFEEIVKKRNKNESFEPLKYWRSVAIGTEGGVIEDSEFQFWVDWLVKNGDLPENSLDIKVMYTNEFNPYAK